MSTAGTRVSAQTLQEGSAQLGVALDAVQAARLQTYLALLERWNRTYNLTAVRDNWVSNHLLDSLAVAPHLPEGSVVDVGSGAGLPGIPLAVAQPARPVTLLDSSHKKGAFLQQALIECGLRNCSVHIGRAEDWMPDVPFDGAISRAFSDLAGFVDAARTLVRAGGWLAAMKGVRPDEELAQLPDDVKVERVVPLQVPGLDASRHLVFMRLEPRP